MNRDAKSQVLLHLLVRMYNRTIQSYYFFPEVVICGNQRLERNEFDQLVAEGYLVCFHTDSFGKLYRLSARAESDLHNSIHRRRHRSALRSAPTLQVSLGFSETL